jgi:hypothetical protein
MNDKEIRPMSRLSPQVRASATLAAIMGGLPRFIHVERKPNNGCKTLAQICQEARERAAKEKPVAPVPVVQSTTVTKG